MDINSDVSGTALRERGLPGWAWFFISFAVTWREHLGLFGFSDLILPVILVPMCCMTL